MTSSPKLPFSTSDSVEAAIVDLLNRCDGGGWSIERWRGLKSKNGLTSLAYANNSGKMLGVAVCESVRVDEKGPVISNIKNIVIDDKVVRDFGLSAANIRSNLLRKLVNQAFQDFEHTRPFLMRMRVRSDDHETIAAFEESGLFKAVIDKGPAAQEWDSDVYLFECRVMDDVMLCKQLRDVTGAIMVWDKEQKVFYSALPVKDQARAYQALAELGAVDSSAMGQVLGNEKYQKGHIVVPTTYAATNWLGMTDQEVKSAQAKYKNAFQTRPMTVVDSNGVERQGGGGRGQGC